jgi:RNA polymerase sigma factor, sigma-70 family
VITVNEDEYPMGSFTVNDVTVLDNLIEEEDRREISRKIQSLLGQLTDRQREAVCLRYIYDMEYKEIAQILNMENEKSARNLVSRAIQKLKMENAYFLFFLPLIKLN